VRVDFRKVYRDIVFPALRGGYDRDEKVPKIVKVSFSRGLGEASKNARELETHLRESALVTGQRPSIRKAKKSVAGFKIRDGMLVGTSVTMRRSRMYAFFSKLVHIVLPRVRDFEGVKRTSFDGRGNYSLGVEEQVVFPEILDEEVTKIQGASISIVTTAKSDHEASKVLSLFGVPFLGETYDNVGR
jgi:large subunit ribosomal protein L5